MPTQTTNYGLVKPATTEFYDVNVQNGNMDLIDTKLKEIEENANTAPSEIGNIDELEVPEVTNIVQAINVVNEKVNEHLADDVVHITPAERTKWNNPATTADKITISDSGSYFTSNNMEGALQEIAQSLNGARGSLIASVNSILGM